MVYDYIIVGSGIAGLYSAYKLHRQGRKVLILEKNLNPGGRMSSKIINNEIENLGANFIMKSYSHVIDLAHELDIKLTPNHAVASKLAIVDENYNINPISFNLGTILKFSKVPLLQKVKFAVCSPYLVLMAFLNPVPNYNRLAKFDDQSSKEFIYRFIGKEFSQYFLEPAVKNLFSYTADYFSRAMALGTLKFFIKGRTYYNFSKGLQELPQKVTQEVETKFGVSIQKILKEDDLVKVIADGETYESSQVILAVPGDKVLNLLGNSTESEKTFFSNVKYSSHIKVFCESSDDIMRRYDSITFPDQSVISSANVTHRKDKTVQFTFGIHDSAAKKLISEKRLNDNEIEEFIRENLKLDLNFKYLQTIIWDSALPVYYPGYIKAAAEFKRHNLKTNQIIYVGDYLSGPFLEGAVLSSQEVFQF